MAAADSTAADSTAAEALFGLSAAKLRQTKHIVVFGAISLYLAVWLRSIVDLGWIVLKGLSIPVPPTREELLKFSASKGGGKSGRKSSDGGGAARAKPALKGVKGGRQRHVGKPLGQAPCDDGKPFTIPNDAPLVIKMKPVAHEDYQNWGKTLEWSLLVHMVAGTLGTALVVEFVAAAFNESSEGLTIVFTWAGGSIFMSWCLMIYSLWEYVANSITNEIVITIVTMVVACMASLFVLLFSESRFDFGLDQGYLAFKVGISDSCRLTGLAGCDTITPSFKVVKLLLAVVSGTISVALLFPTMRFARCQTAALNHFGDAIATKLLIYCNAVLPWLVMLAFVPQLSRDHLSVPTTTGPCKHSSSTCLIVEYDRGFERIRFALVSLTILVRAVTIRTHLQAYLYMPIEQLKSLANGRKQRLNSSAVQKSIGQVSRLALTSAVQLLAPVAFLSSCALVLWVRGLHKIPDADGAGFSMMTDELYRPLFSYICWWNMFSTAAISVISKLYFGWTSG